MTGRIDARLDKLEARFQAESSSYDISHLTDQELYDAIVKASRDIVEEARGFTTEERRAIADEFHPECNGALFGKSAEEQRARQAFIDGNENDPALKAWIADTLVPDAYLYWTNCHQHKPPRYDRIKLQGQAYDCGKR